MTGTTPAVPRCAARRFRSGPATGLMALAAAIWWWQSPTPVLAADQPSLATAAATLVDYPPHGAEPEARTAFPPGASLISGPEILAALSDHTALLPGGFVEYYAPDGKLYGVAEEKHYGGSWQVRDGDFCTLLEGSSDDVCSPVEREGDTLYWSMDGEREASPVTTIPGNPRGLR